MKIKKKVVLVGFLAMIAFASIAFFIGKHKNEIAKNANTHSALARTEEKAVFLYKHNSYEQGGLIEIASTDEPTLNVGSVGISGSAIVTTYQATYDDLLNYLIHNDKYEQKNKSIDVAKLSQVSQANFQINAENDSTMPLSVGENGVWFVRIDLNGTIGEAFIVRTDVGSIASSGDDQIIIWNQNFKTKRLIAGANVAVYNLKGGVKQIETTTSDDDGIAKVKSTEDADVAIIESNGNKTLLPLNYKYLNNSNYTAFQKKKLDNQYFVFTDRPLYRPGDNVKFKAIIRQEDDATFSLARGTVNAKIIKGYDESSVIAQQNFTISAKGTIDGEFNLPVDATPDSYSLVVKAQDSEGVWGDNSISFEVEEFVKPEYGIEATNDGEILIAGDTATVNVHGGYFSGQPLAGEEVKYTVYSSSFSDYGYRDQFDPTAKWRWSWNGSSVFQGSAKLNESGDAIISYQTPNTKEGETSKVYTIETEYVNEGGRPSVSTVNVLVKAGEFGMYKKDYTWGANVDQKVNMPFIVQDKEGKTVTNNMPVKVKTKWSRWNEVQKDGKTEYRQESENLPDASVDSGNGEFAYSFTPSKVGLYSVTVSAKDPRGNVVENTYSVWAYSDKEYGRFSGYGLGSMGITVKADKEKYNPGDDARITILSKELNRDAVLTFERGRSRRYKVVHLDTNQTIITEKIQNDDIPNIFADVSSFGLRDIDNDSANLLVSTVSKKINVTLKSDRDTYGPGDMAVVDVTTTDANGNPISADAAVWAIDKALYELADSNMESIFDTFWYQRGNGTSSAYSLQGISAFGAERGGGGGGDSMRTDLKDTEYWNPSVQTDSTGHARVSFKLPDNLTTWVVATVAATEDARVGQQNSEIVVSKSIIVRPMLPNVLQEGDKIILGAIVQNFSESDQEMNVEASFDSGTIENAAQSISIAKGGSAKVYWEVSPQVVNERSKFGVKAVSVSRPELNDGIILELPVKKYGFSELLGASIVNDGQFPISFPQDARNEKSSVKVEVAASLVGSLSSAMDFLLQYPYGCVEQTTSSFVPAIISKQNKELFQFKKTDISVDDVASKGIARLKDLQNGNGGWGWWGQDNKTNPFISGYVAEYLFKAKNIGYAVDQDMYDSMVSYLKSDLDEFATFEEKRLEKIGKAYALSLIEKGNHLDRQIRDFTGISPDILSLVVMANINNGNMNPADNGLNVLAGLVKDNNGIAYWDGGDLKYFGSQEASTALALRAMILGKANPDLIDKAVKYLTQNKKGSNWQNTFATAQVLQAMVDYAKLKKVNTTNSSYAVFVDGQQISQGNFTDFRQIDTVNIPLEKLQDKGSQISIKKQGEGDVYSTMIANEFRTDKNVEAVSKGLSIVRTYQPENASVGAPLAVGDVVNVMLTVSGNFDDKYVAIEDHLPSGLVPVNPKFNNEQASGGGEAAQLLNGKSYTYEDNREVTKDGMIISVEDLKKGKNTFTYRARVVSQGNFNVIPAVVTKMYSPEVYGRTSAQKVVVQKERIKTTLNVVAEKKNVILFMIAGLTVMLILLIVGYYIWRKKHIATLG